MPMLDDLVSALLILGMGYALLRIVRWQFFFPLVWLGVSLMGGVLSLPFEAPQGHRTMENMLTTALLAGLILGLGATRLTRPAAVDALPAVEPDDPPPDDSGLPEKSKIQNLKSKIRL